MTTLQRGIPLLLFVTLVGCGGSDLELSEVSGVVTLDGEPLPNAVVTFSPKGKGPSAVGKTNDQGEYQLMTAGKVGAVPGRHTVSIIAVPEPEPVEEVISSNDPRYLQGGSSSSANYQPPPVPEVPERYNAQTELTKEVKPGTANTINFDLES